jgi:hypothetical protein
LLAKNGRETEGQNLVRERIEIMAAVIARPSVTLPPEFETRAFCTLRELCELAQLSRMTVLRMLGKGLPYLQSQKGAPLRFPVRDVLDWLIRNQGHGDWLTQPRTPTRTKKATTPKKTAKRTAARRRARR